MNTDEIFEGNKLIAEFMGGRFTKSDPMYYNGNRSFYYFKDKPNIAISDMRYHSSFDWLMPVWVKLRSRVWQKNNGSYPVDFIALSEEFKRECFNATVIAVYEVVLNGVKWYNSTHLQSAPSAQ